MERGAQRYFDEIDAQGGVLRCIENGFFQREIADAAFEFERKLEANERIIVGVNAYTDGEGGEVPTLRIGPETEQGQVRRLKAVRARRDNTSVASRLEELKTAARGSDNLMPPLLNCVKAYATEGEIMAALKEGNATDIVVFGGGIIPQDDATELKKMGVVEIFGPGTSLKSIIDFVNKGFKAA